MKLDTISASPTASGEISDNSLTSSNTSSMSGDKDNNQSLSNHGRRGSGGFDGLLEGIAETTLTEFEKDKP
jgi:hypothetical protein